jgi:hypothetical protein
MKYLTWYKYGIISIIMLINLKNSYLHKSQENASLLARSPIEIRGALLRVF